MEKEFKKAGSNSLKRVVVIGPESTGKSDLTEFLANEFSTCFVPEYAREYVAKIGRKYTYDDVVHIAKRQVELSKELALEANRILFYDTYLIITKVWFDVVFKKSPDWIMTEIQNSNIDLFLLCNTDIPWIPDNVRENGGAMREKLFDTYKQVLEDFGFQYEIISGLGAERRLKAMEIIHQKLI